MIETEEVWKEVASDPNYEVSNLGRVRSLPRLVKCRHGYRMTKPCLLRGCIGNTGYPHVTLSNRVQCDIHALVAEAFIGPRESGMQVNHIDNDRANPRLDNLEYVTPSENQMHCIRQNRRSPSFLGKFSAEHGTSKAVIATSMFDGAEMYFDCALDAVRKHGFESSAISRCCHNKVRYHKGYFWRFAT